MKKLAFALLCTGSLVLAACGGDDDKKTPDVADAGNDTPDAAVQCNPITQSGCEAGEKCAQIVERADDPETADDEFLGRTACVPDGDKAAGEACSTGEAGPMGYDDCQAGYACNGVCVAICDVPQQTGCEESMGTCVLYEHNFDDVGDGGTVGLCAPSCDPVTQTMNDATGTPTENPCPGIELEDGTMRAGACFLNLGLAVTSCATVPEPASAATQDKECYGPATPDDVCYLNGCAGGYLPLWVDPTGAAKRSLCAAYCNHVDTYRETAGAEITGEPSGDPAGVSCTGGKVAGGLGGPYACRNFQDLFADTAFKRGWGVCSAAQIELGDCGDLIKDAFVEAHDEDGVDDDENYCLAAEDLDEDGMLNDLDLEKCPLGCISAETLNEWFPEDPGQARALTPRFTKDGIVVNGFVAPNTEGLAF